MIKPEFSCRLLNIIDPTWSLRGPKINVELSEFQKNHAPNAAYITGHRKINDEQYRNHIAVYTDNSMGDAGVGAAAICRTVVRAASLPIEASIFSAEMHAINIALDNVSIKAESSSAIFCDSLSVVKSLHVHCYHPIIRRLIHRIHDLRITGETISICWIPSHVGIQGNDSADATAKGA